MVQNLCSTAYPVLEAAGALHDKRLRKRSLDTLHVKEWCRSRKHQGDYFVAQRAVARIVA